MTTFDEAMGLNPEAADQADIARHILGLTILPTTVQEIGARLQDAKRGGAMLPSGTPEVPVFHADKADVGKTLTKLEKMGLVKALTGSKSFAEMIAASDKDPDLVQNDQAPGDSPHAEGAYYQTLSRGAQWAENQTAAGATCDGTFWQMTRDGYQLLTGHTQEDYPALAAANAKAYADDPSKGGAK